MKWEQDLIKDIRLHNSNDNDDSNANAIIKRETVRNHGHLEFTDCNRVQLLDKFLKVKDCAKSILEIGVCRNSDQSSTHVFLKNKNLDTFYIGIDIEDKSFLHSLEKNIHTIKRSSSNIDENMSDISKLGVFQFDFIFIDGWHSINQVLIDWEYTRWLSPNGIVGFHDTAEHPGPHLFLKNLNQDKWNVEFNCCPNDWGIGFAWQK